MLLQLHDLLLLLNDLILQIYVLVYHFSIRAHLTIPFLHRVDYLNATNLSVIAFEVESVVWRGIELCLGSHSDCRLCVLIVLHMVGEAWNVILIEISAIDVITACRIVQADIATVICGLWYSCLRFLTVTVGARVVILLLIIMQGASCIGLVGGECRYVHLVVTIFIFQLLTVHVIKSMLCI